MKPRSLLFLLAIWHVSAIPTTFAAEKTLLEWTFDQPGNFQGWQPNVHVINATVAGGALACRTVGHDPMFILGPLLNLPTSPWQVIEVRLKADRDGGAEVFWSNTTQGPFGGLSQDKTTDFHIIGDNQMRTYCLFPFWHPEQKIVKLRLDLFDGATFTIDSIRILELPVPSIAAKADFDFTKGLHAWQPIFNASLAAVSDGAMIADAFALAPPVNINADEDSYVSLRLAVDRGDHATLLFAADKKHGLHTFTFPITADGKEHTYNVDMLNAPNWSGRVLALGLRPSEAFGAAARVRWLKVSAEPQGAPQLRVVSFALEDALPRVGVPATLAAIVANTGGEALKNLRTQLELPKGLRIQPDSAKPPVPALGFGEETRFEFKVQAAEAVKGEAVLRFTADNLQPLEIRAPVAFTPRAQAQKADYVPVPKPVRGTTEVGVYYFPGWNTMSRWQPIQGFPERKPVLGWYREGDPEVADWHIKWAVEHGITYFAYDWYWSQGARQLEHGLHDGYFKARYRRLLKFCLLWANHNPPHTSSHEDCLAVTRYWIENYFRLPEHLTIDGKPAMIIFSTHRLTEDLGSAGVKKAFDAMREECRKAGLKGLYFIACVGNAGQARQAAEEGYDAVSAYNWPGLGLRAGEKRAPFETLPDAYRRNWEHILKEIPIPLSPLPICGGWDSRPWHGDGNLVRYGRTPELFRRHLQDAKQFIESQAAPLTRPAGTLSPSDGARGQADGLNRKAILPNHVLIEAWNEWGEGSYIEPHNEFGFGYLDAIRDVFTAAPKPHVDLTPADVGRGPYDLPPSPPPLTAWDFAQSDEGWNNTMHLADVSVKDGALTGRTTGNDPAFFSSGIQARASVFPSVVLRMKLQSKDGKPFQDLAQLFWRTTRLPESEATSLRFAVNADGQWHDYKLPVSENRRWNGLVTRLRLDPCNRPDVQVAIDSVRLQR